MKLKAKITLELNETPAFSASITGDSWDNLIVKLLAWVLGAKLYEKGQ